MSLFERITGGLQKTRASLMGALGGVLGSFTHVDDELLEELEEILIMADTGVPAAQAVCRTLRERAKAERVADPAGVRGMLRQIVADMLRGGEELSLRTRPSLILLIGVNGTGKTTTADKLARMLADEDKTVLIAAADTFRAAAAEQLGVWAQRAGADLVRHEEGSDPAAVVFDAITASRSRGTDVVICDTAGRLHNKKNLMSELTKISKIVAREMPDADVETLLVLDATTGQNAVEQAREFRAAADITGIVLTKLDGTAKGGVVLAIKGELGLPVKFVGVGEGIDDLQPFDADAFAAGLFEGAEA